MREIGGPTLRGYKWKRKGSCIGKKRKSYLSKNEDYTSVFFPHKNNDFQKSNSFHLIFQYEFQFFIHNFAKNIQHSSQERSS